MRPLLILLLVFSAILAVTAVISAQLADFSAIMQPLIATAIAAMLVIVSAFSRLREKVREARMRVARTNPHPAFGHPLPHAGEGTVI